MSTQSVTATSERLRRLPGRGPVILAPDAAVDLSRCGAIPLMTPATVAELDLGPPLDALHASLHQKWRNRLRHSDRRNLRVTCQDLPQDPAHWLFVADTAAQRRNGYRNWPVHLTLAYARQNPGQAKLFSAIAENGSVAAMLFLRHGSVATYHIGHTNLYGQKTSAHNLLLWHAICWAKRKGLQRLDLGTINTEEQAGLARFKLGTGARARRLGGTWLWWQPVTTLLSPLATLDRSLMDLG